MVNSYAGFLQFLLALGADKALRLIKDLLSQVSFAADAKTLSASGEEINAENSLRELVGRNEISSENLRRLFVASQDRLPAIMGGSGEIAISVSAAAALPTLPAGLSYIQIFRWMMAHLDVARMIGSAAVAIPSAENFVERWGILRPVGDAVAPALDDLFDQPISVSAVDTATGEAVRAELLTALNAPQPGEVAISATRFDGKWLDRAVQLFLTVLPLLLKK